MCCTGQALNKCYPLWMKDTNLSSYYTTQAKKQTSAFIINNIWNIYLGKIFLGGFSYLKHSSITILSLQKCLNLYKKFSLFHIWYDFHSLNMFIECVLCAVLGIKWASGCWLPAPNSCVLRKETQEKERQISFFTEVTKNVVKENRTEMENEAEQGLLLLVVGIFCAHIKKTFLGK